MYVSGVGELARSALVNQMDSHAVRFVSTMGFPVNKRNNLHHIDDQTLLTSNGNMVMLLDINSKTAKYIHAIGNEGIGAICMHPNKELFAVSEKGKDPKIFIYSYPEIKVVNILRKGTDFAYADMEFSADGLRLASLGCAPDYSLSIWDWKSEAILLHTKAFSQEVFRVSFSPNFPGRLFTAGSGHIRFWQMAETFTGLKLKGDIGKFGHVELSDISAYVELHDGKVISGSETGHLLLWEAGMIQMVIGRKNKAPCHSGEITYLAMEDNMIVSAGVDGFICFWDASHFDNDSTDDIFCIEPSTTFQTGCKIRSVSRSPSKNHWIILDAQGGLFKSSSDIEPILEFHAGNIKTVVSNSGHFAFTGGLDATLRIWDLVTSRCVISQPFPCAVTSITVVPDIVTLGGTSIILGFSDGFVRMFNILKEKSGYVLSLAWVSRPHETSIKQILFNKKGSLLASVGEDKTIFFFSCEQFPPKPFGYFTSPLAITYAVFDEDFVYASGTKLNFVAPPTEATSKRSYALELSVSDWELPPLIKLVQGENGVVEQSTPSQPISCLTMLPDGNLAISTMKNDDNSKLVIFNRSLLKTTTLDLLVSSTVSHLFATPTALIVGFSSGFVQVRPSAKLDSYLLISPHDHPVTSCLLTVSPYVLVTSANDGTLCSYDLSLDNNDPVRPSLSDLSISSSYSEVTDMEPNSYTLEQDRLQREEDLKKMDAEVKKQQVRAKIAAIRAQFNKLKLRNDSENGENKLSDSHFEIDPDYYAELKQKSELKIENARRQMAWSSEKHALALAKLRANFLGPLLVEHISLSSFSSGLRVSSFRTPDLPDFLKRSIEEVHQILEQEASRRNEEKKFHKVDVEADYEPPRTYKKGSQSQIRKAARLERKKRRERLEAHKPEGEGDLSALKSAEDNMGDYKLKSDKNYIVPERQRINAVKKRQQMVLLQESVHFIKMGFNERFLALRDLKRRIIENIKKDNARIHEINSKLRLSDSALFEPVIDPAEYPEWRDVVTKADILQYEAEQEKIRKDALKAKTASAYGGGEPEETKHSKTVTEPDIVELSATSSSETPASLHANRLSGLALSEIEQAEVQATVVMLHYERKSLLTKVTKTISAFDQAVSDLRLEKLKLDSDLKETNLKLLTLYQELLLLKQFEGQETVLNAKLQKCGVEKTQIVSDISDCQDKLSHKLNEIVAWQEKDKALFGEFNNLVGGEKNEFYAVLLKIFKKRVKRSKKKLNDESEEDVSDEDFDLDEFDDTKSDDGNDETCPVNCDNSVYEKVLDLRERRLDQEDLLADINKAVEDLKKQNERLQQRERLIDKDVKAADRDIQLFQTEKQRTLNQINVTVPLRLSQLQYQQPVSNLNISVEDSLETVQQTYHLPADISQALIFTSTALKQLHQRIATVQSEKISLKKEITDLRNKQKLLIKQNKSKEIEIDTERRKCENVQLLKLGKLVDIEVLDRMSYNATTEELKQKLAELEAESINRLNDLDDKFKSAKLELVRVLRENTDRLNEVASLTAQQYELEEKLNTRTKNVHVGDTGPMDMAVSLERSNLIETIKQQAVDIDALKTEIHVLRRKGGHMYAPADEVRMNSVIHPPATTQPYISSQLTGFNGVALSPVNDSRANTLSRGSNTLSKGTNSLRL